MEEANDSRGEPGFDPKLVAGAVLLLIAERMEVPSWGDLAGTSEFSLLGKLFGFALGAEFKAEEEPNAFGALTLFAPSASDWLADFAAELVGGVTMRDEPALATGSYGVGVAEGRDVLEFANDGAASEPVAPFDLRIGLPFDRAESGDCAKLESAAFGALVKGVEPPDKFGGALIGRFELAVDWSSVSTWICAETTGGSPAKRKALEDGAFDDESENDIESGGFVVDETLAAGTVVAPSERFPAVTIAGASAVFN